MRPPIPTPLSPHPPFQNTLIQNLPHFDFNRATCTLHIFLFFLLARRTLLVGLVPPPRTQIPARTRTQRTQQILLCEEIDKRIFRCGAGFHEIPSLAVEACYLEDVEHVVHVEFCEAVGEHGAREVGVAVEVVGGGG